jgi:flagellar biosynthetic protein FlhB
MIAATTTADVVVTNPTHLAVALKYEPGEPAPKVVAKGADRLARKIRKTARRHGVPVIEDKPLARTLFRKVNVGRYVPTALFEAVAFLLAVAYKRRARR